MDDGIASERRIDTQVKQIRLHGMHDMEMRSSFSFFSVSHLASDWPIWPAVLYR